MKRQDPPAWFCFVSFWFDSLNRSDVTVYVHVYYQRPDYRMDLVSRWLFLPTKAVVRLPCSYRYRHSVRPFYRNKVTCLRVSFLYPSCPSCSSPVVLSLSR